MPSIDYAGLRYATLFVVAFVVAMASEPLSAALARRLGAVVSPPRRRISSEPRPGLGGFSVLAGLLAALGAAFVLPQIAMQMGVGTSVPSMEFDRIGAGISIVGMFLVGAYDEVRKPSRYVRLIWQVFFATIAVVAGLSVGTIVSPTDSSLIDLGFFTYPVTVLYLVVFANAISFIDGLDGLSCGVTAIAASTLFVTSLGSGRADATTLAIALMGSALGFLRWNLYPARHLLGSSGALLLGHCLGVTSLLSMTRVAGLTTLIVPLVIAGVPLLDSLSAMIRRSRAGVKVGQGDTGHIYHRLMRSGLSERQALVVIYVWTALLCVGAFFITRTGTAARMLIFLSLLAVSAAYAFRLHLFDPVIRRRFDPETGYNEVVPIDEVSVDEDYTRSEIDSILLGGVDNEEVPTPELVGHTDRPLNILAVSQHYWPEPFNFPDICETLAARGHRVTVLTGTPNYPEGSIYPGYEHGAHAVQEHNGVRILRSWLVPRGHDPIHRVLNYYSFSAAASRMARDMEPGFDVVLSFQTSPVMMSNPALAYGRRNSVPVLLYCIDIWPECLTVGGIRRGSAVYRHFGRVSRDIYASADRLAVTSPMFSDYLRDQLGIVDADPLYLPQYAEDIFEGSSELRPEYDPNKLNFTFAGNVGVAQSVNTLVEAGHYLEGDDRFAIHVVGSGSELESLKRYKDEIGASCVEFHGRFPLADMPSFYASSDAMVATFQDSPILGYTLPRKIQSYMAAGRPILGTVVGEARRVIEEAGCGLCCDAGDSEALAQICRQFASMSPAEREAMGERGRSYYQEHYARERFFEALENELVSMTEENR